MPESTASQGIPCDATLKNIQSTQGLQGSQGNSNEHDLLKKAEKDETLGMLKYGVDLALAILKESK